MSARRDATPQAWRLQAAAVEPVTIPERIDGGFDFVSALLGAAALGMLALMAMGGVAFSRHAHGRATA